MRRTLCLGVLSAAVALGSSCGEEFEAAPADGTGAGSGTGSETGANGSCSPGATTECYTGTSSTQQVGLCRAGTAVCDAAGNQFGACQGETLPAPSDNCATPEDENCDGSVNDGCPCQPGTVEPCYSGPAGTVGVGVCAAGTHTCKADGTWGVCANEQLPGAEDCANELDEDCDGFSCSETLWAVRGGSSNSQLTNGVSALDDGSIVATGTFTGSLSFGGPALISDGSNDVFVVKLNSAGGHEWSRAFGGAGTQEGLTVAVDSQGNTFVAGTFIAEMTTTSGSLSSASEGHFLLKLEQDGTLAWAKKTTDGYTKYFGRSVSIAIDSTGSIVVAETTTEDCGSCDGEAARVAKYDTAGNLVWKTGFTGSAINTLSSVSVDSADNIVAGGVFTAELNAGGKSIPTASGTRALVAKLNSSGAVGQLIASSPSNGTYVTAVDVNANGELLACGDFPASIKFGATELVSLDDGEKDIFVFKMDAAGSVQWAKLVSANAGETEDLIAACKFDSTGRIAVAVSISGPVSFGGALISQAGDALVKYAADGNYLWHRSFGPDVWLKDVALTLDNRVVAGGGVTGDFDFGSGNLPAGGGYDAFVISVAP